MSQKQKALVAIVSATVWIGVSEFLRNELVFKSLWIEHYKELGLTFPSTTINNAVWAIWSFCLAVLIYIITRRFTRWQTTAIVWFAGFLMMWLVMGNLNVLPFKLLYAAIPLSLIEVLVAALIVEKLSVDA